MTAHDFLRMISPCVRLVDDHYSCNWFPAQMKRVLIFLRGGEVVFSPVSPCVTRCGRWQCWWWWWWWAQCGTHRSFGGEVRQNPSLPVRALLVLPENTTRPFNAPTARNNTAIIRKMGISLWTKDENTFALGESAGRRSCRGFSERMQRRQQA